MHYFKISESPKLPLQFLNFEIDVQWLSYLIDKIGQERKCKFKQIIISGGVAVSSPWSRTPQIYPKLSDLKANQKHGFVFGYFDPIRSVIEVFPETILEIICNHLGINPRELNNPFIPSNFKHEIMTKFQRQFYPMLIEEIEHGFQDSNLNKYRSFLSRVVHFTSPLMVPYLIVSVCYIVFTNKSYWWSLIVLSVLLLWIFLPVWVSLLPKPGWWRRYMYKFNSQENDAKGKAISIKFYKMGRKAIYFKQKSKFSN